MKKKVWIAAMSIIMAAALWAPATPAASQTEAFCYAPKSTCSTGDQCCSHICDCGLFTCECQ